MNIRKMLVVLTIVIFIASSTGGFLCAGESISNNNNGNTETISEIKNFNIYIGEPTFSYQDGFVTIELDESETFWVHSGEPMLPVITKTFDFPIGTKINEINVDINWEHLDLDRKITPSPVSIPISLDVGSDVIEEKRIDEDIYSSTDLYPTDPYIIKYGAGIKDMKHVVFVNVKCFPQYSPANNYINIPKEVDIDIEYETAYTSEPLADQFDLIIITHDIFKDKLQALVDHKVSKGITTKMVTVDEIYAEYASKSSYDFEQIKMYLADHVLDWDTKFVLLAGGHVGQTNDWYVPDFRSNNFDITDDPYDPHYDLTYSSDIYYADIYYYNQYGFPFMDNWDSNGNGIYAEGPESLTGTDTMDFYPDVHIGRIPLRYEWEADIAVNKIIDYENNADDSWFKKAVLAGGDGFPPERYPGVDPDAWEGEIVCDIMADLLSQRGVTSTKCYCSDQGDIKVNGAKDVYDEVTKGCGFVHLTGHANPWSLGSYEPGTGISPEPPLTSFYTGFNLIQYKNEGKLAFMICEGCHNAEFDVTGQKLINSWFSENPDPDFRFSRYEWIPHDASSWLLLHPGGGAIGIIGNTALGSGYVGEGTTRGLGGWMMLRLAEAWAVDGEDYTGSVFTTAINGYLDNFAMSRPEHRKRVEEEVLLGDPSVRLGGYGSFTNSDESDETEVNYGPISASVPTWSVGDSWTYKLDNIDIDLNPIENRSLILKLSSGDINLEVTEVTSDSYITSVTSSDIDVTLGAIFDYHEPGVNMTVIPEINLDNIQIIGQINLEKDTLGIKTINLRLTLDLIENLDNIKDLLGIELPKFLDFLIPYMSIPANMDLDMEFENPVQLIEFPIENGNTWGIPANNVTITIGGSVESIWLKLLNFVNKFIHVIPDEFAKYLPKIDISEILNDFGIDASYTIAFELPESLMPYHVDTTPLLEVIGTENINTEAGSFNAAMVSIVDYNGKLYYDEGVGTIVKIIGYLSDYIPIIQDINLELKSTNK